MERKIWKWSTDYNKKMTCPSFIHIDVAPQEGTMPQSRVDNLLLEITTLDSSHAPILAKLGDMMRIPLKELSNCLTWPSHGMASDQFREWFRIGKSEVPDDTMMAVYFLKQVKETL